MKDALVKKLTLTGTSTATTLGVGLGLRVIIKKLYPKGLGITDLADMIEEEEDLKAIAKQFALVFGVQIGITLISAAIGVMVEKTVEGHFWPSK